MKLNFFQMLLGLIIFLLQPLELQAAANISPIPPSIQQQMLNSTWHEGCPVALDSLRYLTVPYWGFDHKKHQGHLIIHQSLAKEVVQLFNGLYQQHYPIQKMELMDVFKGNDEAAMAANNTSSFNCRAVTGQPGLFSQHSYGRAIDINPLINPYVKDHHSLLAQSEAHVDRTLPSPGKINTETALYKAFQQRGWDWGGNWVDVQDYQHFEKRAHGEKRNPYGYKNACQTLKNSTIPQNTSQVLVVQATHQFFAKITACTLVGRHWESAFKPISGVIGEHGLAVKGEKKEGDRKTPTGLFPFGEAFGTQPLALQMDFKYITDKDKFIDDSNSSTYNTWVHGETKAKSFENMLIDSYQMGAIIRYNMDPTIPGAGSAIFMHIWKSPTEPTAGCVAMDKKSLSLILHWLDKKQNPYIFIE